MLQKLCLQEAVDNLGKETTEAYAQIWGMDTSSNSMSVTSWLLVVGLFHYTNERWLSATLENQHHGAV